MKKQNEFFVLKYIENCKQLNRSQHTLINYYADLKKFIGWYEATQNKKLSKVDGRIISLYKEFLTYGGILYARRSIQQKFTSMLRRFFKMRTSPMLEIMIQQDPLAIGSRRRHLSAVKNFFEYLKQTHEDHRKIFLINPVKSKIHAIKLKEVDILHTKMIDSESWKQLIEAQWRVRDRLLLHLLYYAGLRLSEVCDLLVEDFDEQTKTLKFKRKGGYIHTLKPQKSNEIFAMLNGFLTAREVPSLFLFPGKKGKRLSNRSMHNQIKSLLKRVHLSNEITPHSFRKACATNLYLKNKDLLYVRDYLNHNDAKVTQTYIDKRTLEAINQILY